MYADATDQGDTESMGELEALMGAGAGAGGDGGGERSSSGGSDAVGVTGMGVMVIEDCIKNSDLKG